MKAISVRQPWASMIAEGDKLIETRKWYTKYRGDILIVSSRRPVIEGFPAGKALAIVKIIDCRKMSIADESLAFCEVYPGAYSWVLADVRQVEPFEVKGKLGIYEVMAEPVLIE